MQPSVIGPGRIGELLETARGATARGDFVEVGVYQGGSAQGLATVATEQGRRLFLFDTFAGMPYQDPKLDRHKVGDFGDVILQNVMRAIPTAIFKVGIFPRTLSADVGPIALAHVDCDQYQSVLDCCQRLGPLMSEGGIMVFDDYDCLEGARRAVDECFGKRVLMSFQGVARVRF